MSPQADQRLKSTRPTILFSIWLDWIKPPVISLILGSEKIKQLTSQKKTFPWHIAAPPLSPSRGMEYLYPLRETALTSKVSIPLNHPNGESYPKKLHTLAGHSWLKEKKNQIWIFLHRSDLVVFSDFLRPLLIQKTAKFDMNLTNISQKMLILLWFITHLGSMI